MSDPAAGGGEGGAEGGRSFEAFVADRDVACPECGYNLRGLRGPACPECGAGAGWSVLGMWGPRSEPRLFRSIEAAVVVGAALALGLLVFSAPGAIRTGEIAPVVGAVALPLVGFATLGVWLATRRRVAKWPRHVQGRAATAAWTLAAALALVAMGVGGL